MVLQGTIKVSKPVGAAAIPVPPVTTPSLKKEKSNGGSSMVWKEATGTSKGGTIVDNNAKLDINKTENPWTEIPGASNVSPATRDTATKNSNWTDDDRYNNSRLDGSRENAEYSGNYPLHKVTLFSHLSSRTYTQAIICSIFYNTPIIIFFEFALHCNIVEVVVILTCSYHHVLYGWESSDTSFPLT